MEGSILSSNFFFAYRQLSLKRIKELYNVSRDMQNVKHNKQVHNENTKSITKDYNSNYIAIMRTNLCNNSDIAYPSDCANFIGGTANEGLHPLLISFIELLRQMLSAINGIESANCTLVGSSEFKILRIWLRQAI
jgi:hypothetical protein